MLSELSSDHRQIIVDTYSLVAYIKFMDTKDTSHLVALMNGLSHEKARLAKAIRPSEIAHRTVWVKQYERQIADEYAHLGMTPDAELPEISEDELLAELVA